MVDRERPLAKLDEMRGYVTELRSIADRFAQDDLTKARRRRS
jgi:hypothetical protein